MFAWRKESVGFSVEKWHIQEIFAKLLYNNDKGTRGWAQGVAMEIHKCDSASSSSLIYRSLVGFSQETRREATLEGVGRPQT